MEKKSGKSGLPWFVAGIALGVLAGFVLAPKSGEETRKIVAKQLDKWRSNTQKKTEELREKLQAAIQKQKAKTGADDEIWW